MTVYGELQFPYSIVWEHVQTCQFFLKNIGRRTRGTERHERGEWVFNWQQRKKPTEHQLPVLQFWRRGSEDADNRLLYLNCWCRAEERTSVRNMVALEQEKNITKPCHFFSERDFRLCCNAESSGWERGLIYVQEGSEADVRRHVTKEQKLAGKG